MCVHVLAPDAERQAAVGGLSALLQAGHCDDEHAHNVEETVAQNPGHCNKCLWPAHAWSREIRQIVADMKRIGSWEKENLKGTCIDRLVGCGQNQVAKHHLR